MANERRELNKVMEVRMAVLETEVKNINIKIDASDKQNACDHSEIKADVKEIKNLVTTAIETKADRSELDGKANREDFNMLRNWVIGGILVSIFIAIVLGYIEKLIK